MKDTEFKYEMSIEDERKLYDLLGDFLKMTIEHREKEDSSELVPDEIFKKYMDKYIMEIMEIRSIIALDFE